MEKTLFPILYSPPINFSTTLLHLINRDFHSGLFLNEQGHLLPHAWVAGDDEMDRTSHFRRDLNNRNEQSLLAVPSNTLIRDLEATPPPRKGRGRDPKTPFVQAHQWRDAVDDDQWTRIKVRDGEKGPLEIEVVACRVQAQIKQRIMQYEEVLVIVRCLDENA